MKKNIRPFLFLFFLLAIDISCSMPDKHFVSIEDNAFRLEGKPFFPVTINYCMSFQTDEKDLWVCPSFDYYPDSKIQFSTRDSNVAQLKADISMIKEMGFNSIRIIGLGVPKMDASKEPSIAARMLNGTDTLFYLNKEDHYERYLSALAELFETIKQAGLKSIFLVHLDPDNDAADEHALKIAERFRNEPSIMAYDLFNEPLYFDTKPDRDKNQVHETTVRWKEMFRDKAPHQLVTIGMAGIREVFAWDPNLIDVDFLSFHPYEYQPEQVRNEMYWYSKYIKKPWMIGETSLPADDDSVTYEEQRMFAAKTLKQNHNCGAIGYSWWQFKDVPWNLFHQNFMGVVNRRGETKTKNSIMTVKGTPKPVITEFQKYNPDVAIHKDSCLCLSNYYNYLQQKAFRISGILTDENNKPIEGGAILVWNNEWTHPDHSISKADGSFEVYTDYLIYHWMVSATMHSMIRGDIDPLTATKSSSDSIHGVNIGTIKLKALSIRD